jgi:mycofactocin biosynthetic radical S-adenosylmethionine protein MftC
MNNYLQLMLKARRSNFITSVLFELTYTCNLDCFFCANGKSAQGTPLSLEQYYHTLELLAERQVLNLTLSGGEPLTHPHFLEIGRRGRDLGFAVGIKSNGHALDQAWARKIRREIDPRSIDLSLHGATAETHDRQTGRPGSFERLLRHIPAMLAEGLQLRLVVTATRWNEGELEQMADLAQGLGVPVVFSSNVFPRDDRDTTPLEIQATPAGVERCGVIVEGIQRQRRPAEATEEKGEPPATEDGEAPQCGAGANTLAVDPFGNVYPCVAWRLPVGNLHQQDIGEIMDRSAALREARRITIEARKRLLAQDPAQRPSFYCVGERQSVTGRSIG